MSGQAGTLREAGAERAPVVVTGVIGNDIHVVANRVIQICLEDAGFRTVNIGINNRPEDFADMALEVNADALLVGSLNGEAPYWCQGFRQKLRERGMDDILVYLGGNVVTGELDAAGIEATFRGMDIDRIFAGATDVDALIDTLKEDLAHGRAAA